MIAMEVLIPPSSVMIPTPYRRCKKTRRAKKRKCKYDDEEEFHGDYKRQSPSQIPTSPLPSSPQYISEEEELMPVKTNSPRNEPDVQLEERKGVEVDQEEDDDQNDDDDGQEDGIGEEEGGCPEARPSLQANRRFLRPFDVPKAPSNSTQFIIDDHENCNLYLSFESPRPTYTGHNNEEFSYEDQGYWDIDYEYESPDDVDTTVAFFERDFEMIYNRAREEELLAVARTDLIEQFVELEERATNLEDQLSTVKGADVPSSLMDISYFQGELLRLQEENLSLRRYNRNLKQESKDEL